MQTSILSNFLGRKVKLITQEPGSSKVNALKGIIESIEGDLIVFRTEWGTGLYNVNYIVAIKPLKEERQ